MGIISCPFQRRMYNCNIAKTSGKVTMYIEGYEGLYTISEDGIVTAASRTITNKNGKEQYYPEKVLKQDKGRFGHSRVTLCKDHTTKRFLVHRLVAEKYIPNPENKEFINHIDNNPLNNSKENLEWCTHSENVQHAQKQGRLFESQSKGGSNGGKQTTACNKINQEMIGTIMGCWKILALAEYRNKKHYFHVKCIVCGNTVKREKVYLRNQTTPNCIRCKTRD